MNTIVLVFIILEIIGLTSCQIVWWMLEHTRIIEYTTHNQEIHRVINPVLPQGFIVYKIGLSVIPIINLWIGVCMTILTFMLLNQPYAKFIGIEKKNSNSVMSE